MRATLLLVVAALPAAPVAGQAGVLFTEPFRVEHHLVQEDGDGTRFVGETVVDIYGGSWIVSQRPDGSRLIVDLVRRELTEVRTDRGLYWTVSFDRFAEMQAKRRATPPPVEPRHRAAAAAAAAPAELVVQEIAAGAGSAVRATADAALVGVAGSAGVRHLRVTARGAPESSGLDVWVDPSLRLGPAALAAVGALEDRVLQEGARAYSAVAPGRFLAAARAHAAGAFPVRTVRPLALGAGAAAVGSVEDVVTRLERLDGFPGELAEIPEGLRRVPHPLEAMLRFLEQDAERDAALAGRKRPAGPQD